MSDVFITEAELAERFRVARRTVQRWRVNGVGPPFVRIGVRKIAYRLADCEAWAAGQTFTNRADEVEHS